MNVGVQATLAVCDLCLSNEIHETVNLGFLYGVSLIQPKQDIYFYADKGHQAVIKENIKLKGLDLHNIKYVHIPANLNSNYWGYLTSYKRIKKILDSLIQRKTLFLLVLSSVDFQRLILKRLLKRKCYQEITCCFVMHGDLDNLISPKHKLKEVAGTYFESQQVAGTYLSLKSKVRYIWKHRQTYFTPQIDFKKHLLSYHSSQVRYIVLAPHIIPLLLKYVDPNYLSFHYLPHPAVFNPLQAFTSSLTSDSVLSSKPSGKLKCAVFGYGNPSMLLQLNQELAKQWKAQTKKDCAYHLNDLENHLEIRIIGSNQQGTETFPWIHSPIKKRTLSRLEMEQLAQDIDFFLILYESHRYRLSCSGSIIEALSYQKPVLFLDNPCIQAFNPTAYPIGQNFDTIQSLASSLINYVKRPKQSASELEEFKRNMVRYRPLVDIRTNISKLKIALGLETNN